MPCFSLREKKLGEKKKKEARFGILKAMLKKNS